MTTVEHVHHWCGKAERHARHGTGDGWCNGFGLLAGPGCFNCRDCQNCAECKIPAVDRRNP